MPTLKRADKGMVDTIGDNHVKSAIDAIGVADIDDVGSSWDTTGGKVEQGNSMVVLVDIKWV